MTAKFIEVTCAGEQRLINANIIEEVRINWDGGADIYLAFTCPGASEQDYMSAKESYSQIREMLMGGAEV